MSSLQVFIRCSIAVFLVSGQMLGASVSLVWTPNTETNLAGYWVYRTQTPGANYVRLNTNLATSASFVDSTAVGGTTYYYAVSAANSLGLESGRSSEVMAVIPLPPSPTNHPPIASAGPDQMVPPGAGVTLRCASSDPDGDLLARSWSQVSGPAVSLSGASTATSTFTAPSPTSDAQLVFRLTVNDGKGGVSSDDVSVVVDVNGAPTANAGPDQGVTPNTVVTLRCSSTDPDGDPLTRSWSQTGGPAVALQGATSATSTFTAPSVTVVTPLTFRLTVNDGKGHSASDDVAITVNPGNGLLTGSMAASPASVNLTSEGTMDWAHWGLAAATSFNHKAAVTSAISNYTSVGSAVAQRLQKNSTTYSWTGGTPTVTATNTPNGVWVMGLGNGFQISAPADTTKRTLKLYLGVWAAQGKLEATLSDGSAAAFADISLVNQTASSNGVYTLTYQAGAAGQTVRVKWTVQASFNSYGNITLQAASLTGVTGTPVNQPPTANAGVDKTATSGSSVTLSGSGSDPNGDALTYSWSKVSGPAVTLQGANTTTCSFTAPPVTASTSLVFRLTVSDGKGGAASDDITITVTPPLSTGMLSCSQMTAPASLNLATEGSLDWAHWGLTSTTSYNHKGSVTPKISNYTVIGSGAVKRQLSSPTKFSWTGGTPTASATNTATGVYKTQVGTGFQLTVPADTTSRTLKVYLGVWRAQGKLEATLSDGSAPGYVNTSVSNQTGTTNRVYTLNYRAAAAGNSLTIKWTVQASYHSSGNITMQAATLVASSSSTVSLVAPASMNGVDPLVESSFVGIAVLNTLDRSDNVQIAAVNGDGSEQVVKNRIFAPGAQDAFLADALMPSRNAVSLKARADAGGLRGFFMVGRGQPNQLDGVGGELSADNELIFPVAQSSLAVKTIYFLTNTRADLPANISLEMLNSAGQVVKSTTLQVAPGASKLASLASLIGIGAFDGNHYLQMTSDVPVQGFELMVGPDDSSSAAAQSPAPVGNLWVPHYVLGREGEDTELRLINPGPDTIQASVSVYSDQGVLLGTRPLAVAGRGLAITRLSELLGLDAVPSDGSSLTGHLVVDTPRSEDPDAAPVLLLGTATFTGKHGRAKSTLPMWRQPSTETLYLQVAQSQAERLFTGLAVMNPNSEPVSVTVRAVDKDGQTTGEKTVTVEVGQRLVDLLNGPALFGPTFNQVGGHLQVTSDQPVVSFVVFGDGDGRFLAAVEGQAAQ